VATSGTAVWNPDVATLVEEAAELAGYNPKAGYELRSAIRSLNLIASEWANKGLNLWTVEQGTTTIPASTAFAALASDTVDILDIAVRQNSTDYPLRRIGVASYANIPNKSQTGTRPTQYYVQRGVPPTLYIWPLSAEELTLVWWRMRRIQDAGNVDNTFDVPHRFIPALVYDLASKLHAKRPDMKMDRLSFLESKREAMFNDAADEDRGRESFWVAPEQ